jgi:hypothetical protein
MLESDIFGGISGGVFYNTLTDTVKKYRQTPGGQHHAKKDHSTL